MGICNISRVRCVFSTVTGVMVLTTYPSTTFNTFKLQFITYSSYDRTASNNCLKGWVRDQQQHRQPYKLPGQHYTPGWRRELQLLRWKPLLLHQRQRHRPPTQYYIPFGRLHKPMDPTVQC